MREAELVVILIAWPCAYDKPQLGAILRLRVLPHIVRQPVIEAAITDLRIELERVCLSVHSTDNHRRRLRYIHSCIGLRHLRVTERCTGRQQGQYEQEREVSPKSVKAVHQYHFAVGMNHETVNASKVTGDDLCGRLFDVLCQRLRLPPGERSITTAMTATTIWSVSHVPP